MVARRLNRLLGVPDELVHHFEDRRASRRRTESANPGTLVLGKELREGDEVAVIERVPVGENQLANLFTRFESCNSRGKRLVALRHRDRRQQCKRKTQSRHLLFAAAAKARHSMSPPNR